MPRTSHRTQEHSVGFITINKSFIVRIPAKFAFERHGDITEVANGCGSVSDFYRCGRPAAGFDTIDEIAVMVVALVQ